MLISHFRYKFLDNSIITSAHQHINEIRLPLLNQRLVGAGTIVRVPTRIIRRAAKNRMNKSVQLHLLRVKDQAVGIGTEKELDTGIYGFLDDNTIVAGIGKLKILRKMPQQ